MLKLSAIVQSLNHHTLLLHDRFNLYILIQFEFEIL